MTTTTGPIRKPAKSDTFHSHKTFFVLIDAAYKKARVFFPSQNFISVRSPSALIGIVRKGYKLTLLGKNLYSMGLISVERMAYCGMRLGGFVSVLQD
jgi:hypothetical protein